MGKEVRRRNIWLKYSDCFCNKGQEESVQYQLELVGCDDDADAVADDEEVAISAQFMGQEVLFCSKEHKESFIRLTDRQKEYIAAYMLTGSTMDVARVVGVTANPRTVGKTLGKIAKRMGLSGLRELKPKGETTNTATASNLRALLESQEYKCALSGVMLSPDSAQLDHKIPLSDGGTNRIDNLQWVTRQVNAAKGTMSQSEFVAMCLQVAATHGK
jgi:alkylated DNA nucleotide flippase Atl1/YHS domain-containing protein